MVATADKGSILFIQLFLDLVSDIKYVIMG